MAKVSGRRRRRVLAIALAVVVVAAVAGLLLWQERAGQTASGSPTWRAGDPTSSAVAPAPPDTAESRYDVARRQLTALQVRG